ncbi:hypothetical protein Plhal304r1_c044g0125051 [Plasmopara halstedii]
MYNIYTKYLCATFDWKITSATRCGTGERNITVNSNLIFQHKPLITSLVVLCLEQGQSHGYLNVSTGSDSLCFGPHRLFEISVMVGPISFVQQFGLDSPGRT